MTDSDPTEEPSGSEAAPVAGPKRRWRRIIVRLALGILLTLGLLIGWFCLPFDLRTERQRRPIVSEETTAITKPLDAEGYVDYLRALDERTAEDVTPENNAGVPILRALGPEPLNYEDDQFAEACERLKIEPPPRDAKHFIEWRPFCERIPKERAAEIADRGDPIEKGTDAPWTPEEFPLLSEWLDMNESALALITEASRRKRFYLPYLGYELTSDRIAPQLLSESVWRVSILREPVRALTVRAMRHLGTGDVDHAMADLEASLRLVHLSGQHAVFVQDLTVSGSVGATTFDAHQALTAHADFSADEWLAHRDRLTTLPPFRSLWDILDDGERWFCLEWVTELQRGRFDPYLFSFQDDSARPEFERFIFRQTQRRLVHERVDWHALQIRINKLFDRLIEIGRRPESEERTRLLRRFDRQYDALAKPGKRGVWHDLRRSLRVESVTDQILHRILPFGYSADPHRYELRRRQRNDLRYVMLTLAAFQAKTGSYPKSLEALTPDLMKTIPLDRYDQQPLRYERTANGFRLWSVGMDGIDSRGKTYRDNTEHSDVYYDDYLVEVPIRPPSE